MEGYGDSGYGTGGWKMYILNNNTGTWEWLATATGSSYETKTSTKTTNLSYYVNGSYYIKLLMVSTEMDSNGGGAEIYLDYAYVTLTYTAAAGIPMPQIISIM